MHFQSILPDSLFHSGVRNQILIPVLEIVASYLSNLKNVIWGIWFFKIEYSPTLPLVLYATHERNSYFKVYIVDGQAFKDTFYSSLFLKVHFILVWLKYLA